MTLQQRMVGWEGYPITLPRSVRGVDDVYDLQTQLEHKSDSLFASEPSTIKLEVSIQGVEETREISSITSLEEFLIDAVEARSTKFFIISRRNSWTRLKISFQMFKMLCHFYQIFPKYLESVFGFSVETCKTAEYFSGGCCRHVHDENKSSAIFEISYNVRHFEKHGRNELQDPWSSRQCSVYQNYSNRTNASTWIFIHVPSGTRSHLDRLNSDGLGPSTNDHPMDIHMHLLLSCEKNWGPYIGYLGEEVLLMNRTISFPKPYAEFDLDVSHSQTLAHLRRKLEDAGSLLESNLDIASMLSQHANEMQERRIDIHQMHTRFQAEVQQYELKLRCHIRNVKKHLGLSEDIRLLILKIIAFRNDEHHRRNSNSLIQIAATTAFDSQMMKIATYIGLFYAPISLLTSFYSTPLVQHAQVDGEVAKTWNIKDRLTYAGVSVVLILCTVILLYILRRRRRKRNTDCEKLMVD